MSIYYQDPEGNGVEIQVDGFGDWADSKEWISSANEFAENPIGVFFEPEKLVDARDAGLSFLEIHERTRAVNTCPSQRARKPPARWTFITRNHYPVERFP